MNELSAPEKKIDAIALKIATAVYGGVAETSTVWPVCRQLARDLLGDSNSIVFGNNIDVGMAFAEARQFNAKYPTGTDGVITLFNGEKKSVKVGEPAVTFAEPDGTSVAMAWFTEVGWRPVSGFTLAEKPLSAAEELTNLGQQAANLQKRDMALALYEAAARADDTAWRCHNERGVLLIQDGDLRGAVAAFTAAICHNPRSHEALNNRAMTYRMIGEPERAVDDATAADLYSPGTDMIRRNLALALDDAGNIQAALEIMDEFIIRNPADATSYYNRALMMLSNGDLAQGWREFRWRLLRPTQDAHYEHYNVPQWDGRADLTGKRVLVWAEHGIGDEILVASMLSDLQKVASHVVFLCSGRLAPLMRRSFPGIVVRARPTDALSHRLKREPLPAVVIPNEVRDGNLDYQLSMGDLGQLFRSSFDHFPQRYNFLVADMDRMASYRARHRDGDYVVGISWHSNKNIVIGNLKSLTLEDMLPILKMPGVRFVNLQYGDNRKEIAALHAKSDVMIEDWGLDQLNDIDGFAAAVASLDLVITCSNTTAHIAGGLGVPTWVMVPEGPGKLWYWWRNRQDCPWYSSVVPFRQARALHWDRPVGKIAARLQSMVVQPCSP